LGGAIAGPAASGRRIRVKGRVLDGLGAPLRDGVIEVWQADSEGRYNGGHQAAPAVDFRGWGRVVSDFATGAWAFETIKPGPVPFPGGAEQAPHLNLWIVARGINIGLNTRMYFADEAEANARDPILNLIEWEARRTTLIAPRLEHDPMPIYRFDIRLQGENETVFFDL